jgi:alkylhydroperoxidase family enzyme
LLGHALDRPVKASGHAIDTQLVELAERVTLVPWLLDDRSYESLRASGFDDAAVFDVCVVASTAGMVSRIRVARAASR